MGRVKLIAAALTAVVLSGCGDADHGRPLAKADPQSAAADFETISPLQVPGGLRHDFGRVDRYLGLEHQFVIQNDGEETIRLRKGVARSCGCTNAELSGTVLPSGGHVVLTVKTITDGQHMKRRSLGAQVRTESGDPLDFVVSFTPV